MDERREEADDSSTLENHRIKLELLERLDEQREEADDSSTWENRRIRLELLEIRKTRTL